MYASRDAANIFIFVICPTWTPLCFREYAFTCFRRSQYELQQGWASRPRRHQHPFCELAVSTETSVRRYARTDPGGCYSTYGTLTRTVIEDQIPADGRNDSYPVETTEKIISVLSAVMNMQFSINNILRDMRFKVPVDLEKKYRFLQDAEFVQISKFPNLHTPEYLFRSLTDYYAFLILQFIAENPRVSLSFLLKVISAFVA